MRNQVPSTISREGPRSLRLLAAYWRRLLTRWALHPVRVSRTEAGQMAGLRRPPLLLLPTTRLVFMRRRWQGKRLQGAGVRPPLRIPSTVCSGRSGARHSRMAGRAQRRKAAPAVHHKARRQDITARAAVLSSSTFTALPLPRFYLPSPGFSMFISFPVIPHPPHLRRSVRSTEFSGLLVFGGKPEVSV